jgi:hypothetical protein
MAGRRLRWVRVGTASRLPEEHAPLAGGRRDLQAATDQAVGGDACGRLDTATAASLWATGAIGVSVGLGASDLAVTVAAFTFLTLKPLPLVKDDDESGDKKD